MQNVTKTFVASASELQSSDLYMTVKTTMFTVPSANLNGVRCTAEFLDEIVEHQDKYVALPLCADVVNLVKGKYEKLGHCYNARTGTFSSSIIGSFYKFEKEEMENGETALVGYARIMKRNKNVCKAIGELFAEGALKVSFEISCGSYEELDDGTILIGRSDKNFLEGMCVVSFPACPDAIAHELVAEINSIGKEADEMTDVFKNAEVVVSIVGEEQVEPAAEEVVAEEAREEQEIAESEPAEEQVEIAQEEEAQAEEDKPEETEIAEVRVSVNHFETETVRSYDTETGVETVVTQSVEESVYGIPAEGQAQAVSAEAEEHEEEQKVEVAQKERTASEQMLDRVIAELEAMRKELAEMKASRNQPEEIVAEEVVSAASEEPIHDEGSGVNPFIAEISTPRRYSLLESAAKNEGYSLLERA